MIDLNNPRFVSEWSPEAEWKRALIIELGRRFSINTFVETGTCWGDTIESVRFHFKQVYSIELSPTFFLSAEQRFSHIKNVHLFFGSSSKVLKNVLRQISNGRVLFWLDAHVTGGPSANDGDQLKGELETISEMCPDSLVLIDDVKPNSDGSYLGPDAPISLPEGWTAKFLSGVLIVQRGERYFIPERF